MEFDQEILADQTTFMEIQCNQNSPFKAAVYYPCFPSSSSPLNLCFFQWKFWFCWYYLPSLPKTEDRGLIILIKPLYRRLEIVYYQKFSSPLILDPLCLLLLVSTTVLIAAKKKFLSCCFSLKILPTQVCYFWYRLALYFLLHYGS